MQAFLLGFLGSAVVLVFSAMIISVLFLAFYLFPGVYAYIAAGLLVCFLVGVVMAIMDRYYIF